MNNIHDTDDKPWNPGQITGVDQKNTAMQHDGLTHVTVLQDTSTNTQATVTTEKPLRPLTRKQRAFVQTLVNNPKISATKAVQATYGKPGQPVTNGSARMIASENLTKPSIMVELAKYSTNSEYNLIKLANTTTEYALQGGRDGAAYASVAEKVNNSILDRLHGKATTKIEQQTTTVMLQIDLTQAVTPDPLTGVQ